MVQSRETQASEKCSVCRGTGVRERLVPREPGETELFYYRLMPCPKCAKERCHESRRTA